MSKFPQPTPVFSLPPPIFNNQDSPLKFLLSSMSPNPDFNNLGLPVNRQMMVPQIPIFDTKPFSQWEKEEENSAVWDMCQEITNKHNWYQKVFNTNIVHQWRDEIPENSHDDFDFAIKLLQSTAQGSIHLPDCNWDEDNTMCRDCLYELKRQILDNPEMFDLEPEDIGLDFFKEGWEIDFEDDIKCRHPRCSCTAPDSSLGSYVDYHPDGVITSELHAQCKRIIAELAEKEPVDYHPGSNNQVRDLIHPSMFCYVKGVSEHYDGSVSDEVDESIRYQWLPSEFTISNNGNVTIDSYINNLNSEKYPEFIPIISRVFESFIPSLERVLKKNVRNRSLQVIVKVGHIVLTPKNPDHLGSSWHVEACRMNILPPLVFIMWT